MMTDPIADMLTRIRNAARAKKSELVLPHSRIKWEIAKILEKGGYLERVLDVPGPRREIRLVIRFEAGAPRVQDLKRISKPGRRVYVGWQEIPRVLSGYGMAIVSTSQGMMPGHEARARKLGGELICEVS
ncbi:30S ribosomal protein S8 [Candidatus Uhrbacteria bacterium RIFCSPHIGHO2_12_FULL_57_11]|uniref:Small ribosomal subunit protein uS8 n=2 Tax=Candidatus Uhriibacteriota TaxID=1752732 RepID=A0A1F7UJT1_9BACT|nr:MAG: 30S ribosomal protein S8 [Candidatus Uhrbacteria bacterium RIFCSPHIGHO2_02_FULL_57_19]OGL78543.1 MAG: 30S ribosomal protein S8 [Candidatus Uhrbacteria bacterium RIFCSPHIGHO2_12_FULL_57_11]